MIDELLDFYNRELKFIREEGRAFAQLYPKIATRLKLSTGDTLEDPHVARLVESFALLCARLRLKIEDEFPEVCHAILQTLYPQYLAPVPPVGICRFQATELAAENHEGIWVKRGARLETEDVEGQSCVFRTCFATRVFPIEIASADYQKPPFTFPIDASWSGQTQAALRLRLRSVSDKMPISKMLLKQLQLYMGSSESCGNELYEALMRDAVGIGLFSSGMPQGVFLSASALKPMGFGDDEALLGHDARTLTAYRYLWEFFTAADKFRFVSIDIGSYVSTVARQDLDVVIYLSKVDAKIARELANDTIGLHCTPIINLFGHVPEPIRLTGNQTEYRIVPSYRRPQGMEVISVDSVVASHPGGAESREFLPFHMPAHVEQEGTPTRYWQMSRRRRLTENMEGDRGTEVYLTLVDLGNHRLSDEEWTLHVKTTCCNRDLVADLPTGAGRPFILLQESSGLIRSSVISPLTPTRRPALRDEFLWRLISHLTVNHLTLTNSESGAETLREILRLYNPSELDEHRKAIDSIQSIRYERGTTRVPAQGLGARNSQGTGFCRGLEIEMAVDEERLVGMGSYLFFSVLDRFFSCFATINSYTRLQVRSTSEGRLLYVGKPRAGGQQLL